MSSVAVVILTWNSRKHIVECLRSVTDQSYPKDHYKVVVVDNCSEDDTVSWIQKHYPDVELIINKKNLGYAGGNNVGIAWAYDHGFDHVVVLNDDMKVHNAWLSELVLLAEQNDRIGLVQSKVLFMHEEYRVNTVGNPLHPLGFTWSGGYKSLSSEHQHNRQIALASGSCVLIKRSVIERIGYFDSKMFMYHEDVDYSWRARLAGFDIWLAAGSKVYHDYSFSFGKNKIFYLSERNRLVVYLSHYRLWTLLVFLPAFLITEVVMLLYAMMQGALLAKLRSYISLLWFIPHILSKRMKSSSVRRVTDKEILIHTTCKLDFEEVNNWLLLYVYNPLSCVYFKLVRVLLA